MELTIDVHEHDFTRVKFRLSLKLVINQTPMYSVSRMSSSFTKRDITQNRILHKTCYSINFVFYIRYVNIPFI